MPHTGTPEKLVSEIARGKVEAVVQRLTAEERALSVVIGGDLLTFLENMPYGKPDDLVQAQEYIGLFMGKTHLEVGSCVVWSEPIGYTEHTDSAQITLPSLSDNQLQEYLQIADPTDKAGAISAREWHVVAKQRGDSVTIQGAFTTVIGLNLETAARLLQQHGIPVSRDPLEAEKEFEQEFFS